MSKMAFLSVVACCAVVSFSVLAKERLQLTQTIESSTIKNLELTIPVGRLDIKPSTTEQIELHVELVAKSGWLSKTPDLSEAKLAITTEGDRADARISLEDEDNIEQNWVLYLPKDVDLSGRLGVGTVQSEQLSQSLRFDVGVGSAKLRANLEHYKRIELDVGVGRSKLTGQGIQSKSSLLGGSTRYEGSGRSVLVVDVGVGDIHVKHQL